MTMTHCPHCGEQLEPEIKRPDGCVCDAQEWDDPYNLPPVCDKFDPDSVGHNCVRCEHDYECHAEARANGEGRGASRLAGEASSAEGATSTVVGGRKESK